jgi:hypothetical protein
MAAALLVAGQAPTAEGHIVTFQQAQPLVMGPYNALVEPKPDPMFANSALSMTAIFSRIADGTYAPDVPATLQLLGPDVNKTSPMQPDGTGYDVASVLVPNPGNYTARVGVTDANGTYWNQTTFYAYPDLPIRIQSEDPSQPDPYTNQTFQISIVTLDNITLARTDAIGDLTVYMEQWSDDHRILYSTTPYPMTHAGKGLWHLDYVFPRSGMYHLQFSSVSGGFKPNDVPILHVYALDAPGGNKKLLPDGGVALGALALCAVAVALGRRR